MKRIILSVAAIAVMVTAGLSGDLKCGFIKPQECKAYNELADAIDNPELVQDMIDGDYTDAQEAVVEIAKMFGEDSDLSKIEKVQLLVTLENIDTPNLGAGDAHTSMLHYLLNTNPNENKEQLLERYEILMDDKDETKEHIKNGKLYRAEKSMVKMNNTKYAQANDMTFSVNESYNLELNGVEATEEEIQAAKDEMRVYATSFGTTPSDELSATTYNATVSFWNKNSDKINYSAYAGLKFVDVSGTVNGVDDSNQYAQGVVGFEVGYNVYKNSIQLIGAIEGQVGADVVGISPIVGIRGYITDALSIDIKAEYLNIEMNGYDSYEPVASFGINYRF